MTCSTCVLTACVLWCCVNLFGAFHLPSRVRQNVGCKALLSFCLRLTPTNRLAEWHFYVGRRFFLLVVKHAIGAFDSCSAFIFNIHTVLSSLVPFDAMETWLWPLTLESALYLGCFCDVVPFLVTFSSDSGDFHFSVVGVSGGGREIELCRRDILSNRYWDLKAVRNHCWWWGPIKVTGSFLWLFVSFG